MAAIRTCRPNAARARRSSFTARRAITNRNSLTLMPTSCPSLMRPNRYRLPDGQLTPAQERGKAIFERTVTKAGKPIPERTNVRTATAAPNTPVAKFSTSDQARRPIALPLIDTPQLPNIAYSAPYLHDGSARSLEEIWTVFNPQDTHGVTNDLTKDELNDLIEYLRTL